MKKAWWVSLLLLVGGLLYWVGHSLLLERAKEGVIERLAERFCFELTGKSLAEAGEVEREQAMETAKWVFEKPPPVRRTLGKVQRSDTEVLRLQGMTVMIEAPEKVSESGGVWTLVYQNLEVVISRAGVVPEIADLGPGYGEGLYERQMSVLLVDADAVKKAGTFGELRKVEELLFLKMMSQPIKLSGPREEVEGDGFVGLLGRGPFTRLVFRPDHDEWQMWALVVQSDPLDHIAEEKILGSVTVRPVD